MLELDKSWHDMLVVSDCLLKNDNGAHGTAPIFVPNTSFSTQVLRKGMYLGEAATVNLIHVDAENGDSIVAIDESLTTDPQTYSNECKCWQKQELQRQLQYHPQSLSVEEMSQVYNVLEQHQGIFSMDEGEQVETNHVEFNIDTGESTPIKQVARRVSFAAGQEIAAQLSKMQEEGVILPLNSPWAALLC